MNQAILANKGLQRFSLIVSLLTMALINPVNAQEKLLRTLTVTGRGVESIQTTKTQVELGVEVQGKSATSVQEDVARRSSAVVELLKSRNVEKLQTTGIRLNPIYSYENNKQQLTGYSATNTVSFRLPTEQAGTLLDDAIKAGATKIDGVSFTATEEAIATAQKLALQKATQEAQSQAEAVLGSLNLSRKEIVNIQVNNATPPPEPRLAQRQFSTTTKLAGEAIVPVVGGEQEVQASVTLQISY
ncbi:MAG: SIMPL domain-containing protein [Coleofasciculaceae cyanobacterium]